MIVVTSSFIAGKKIVKTLGMVRGNTIRARAIGRDITAAFKQLFGGEIEEYTKLMGEAREQAMDRMIANAVELGANAIVAHLARSLLARAVSQTISTLGH